LIKEIRAGLGFLAAIDLADEVLAEQPAAVARWQMTCRDAGVLVRPLGRGIAVSPPLTVGQDEIGELADGIAQGLAMLAPQLAAEA
jgi:putrescine---pyruvate transaminase